MCDNFCLWNREMLTEKDFYDYFAEETISIGFVSTHKPEEPNKAFSHLHLREILKFQGLILSLALFVQ
ncbi:MAG: hypothetical protein EHM73_04460 [Chroococcales cyanobacterium metabat2.561]|uniref:Uncharacterized protein n=1 Tax=Microcystis aeruginosa Ma_SC_T_19800800_S464 TaxID=2486257 RepID=A0A552DVH1_MICAE|nr:MAG: hypothetical protein EHM73_04460 [Chroococcales cyanobacterium metabat2.561]TRU26225.1 MAG: hypothetical protein EWV81_10515 [Microcystis aeruginosa Ma_SC_T_19800800_S464]